MITVIGVDPGTKSGLSILRKNNDGSVDVIFVEKFIKLEDFSVFRSQFAHRFLPKMKRLMGEEWVPDGIFIEEQYFDFKKFNPSTLKNIVQKRTWWETELYRHFNQLSEWVYPNSWQSKLNAGGRKLKRADRDIIAKNYVATVFGLKLTSDECAAIGIALAGIETISRRKLMVRKKKR